MTHIGGDNHISLSAVISTEMNEGIRLCVRSGNTVVLRISTVYVEERFTYQNAQKEFSLNTKKLL